MNKEQVMNTLNCSVDSDLNIGIAEDYVRSPHDIIDSNTPLSCNNTSFSCYYYWQDYYYPQVIRESYPVYIQERAKDKGKQAFEIIKILKDKKLVDIKKVGNFIDLMDELIKIL